MTQAQLSKIWLIVSLFLLYYALNSWIVAQGGNEIFGAKLVISSKAPAALIAIPICSVLLALSSSVGLLFALRGGSRWHERVPVVGFEKIATGTTEGRIYQGFMLSIFSILPAIALLYFWFVISSSKVVLSDSAKSPLSGIWDWSGFHTLDDPARICTDDQCLHDATIIPGLEPAIFAILTVVAFLFALAHWFRVCRSKSSGLKPASSAQGR